MLCLNKLIFIMGILNKLSIIFVLNTFLFPNSLQAKYDDDSFLYGYYAGTIGTICKHYAYKLFTEDTAKVLIKREIQDMESNLKTKYYKDQLLSRSKSNPICKSIFP